MSRLTTGGPTVLFVGIGGISMRSLAQYLKRLGCRVRGCDREESEVLRRLREEGIAVVSRHTEENAYGADLVVYSFAVPPDAPELCYACRVGIPVISRAELLGALMLRFSERIGVSGTHGKSGTVARLSSVFRLAGRRPTVLCGACLPSGEPHLFAGEETLIYEACEYREAFLHFSPTLSVLLNLERDHTDCYPSMEALRTAFLSAADLSPAVIWNADDRELSRIAARTRARCVSFGTALSCDLSYRVTDYRFGYVTMEAAWQGRALGALTLGTPGLFQAGNAAAAIAAALYLGIDFSYIAAALRRDTGIPRRLERLGTLDGRPVYYDYAHHPTEIAATVDTLHEVTGGPLTLLFSPHTFSRTQALFSDFVSALSRAETVLLLPIYAAREESVEGVSAEALARAIGARACALPFEEALPYARARTEGALVLLGAGDLSSLLAEVRRELL